MSQDVKKLTYTDPSTSTEYPVIVDSAIRDSDGLIIKNHYQKNPKVIEYTVPSTVGSGEYVLAELNGTYDGSPGYVRFRFECVSLSYTQNAELICGWAKNVSNDLYVNILGCTTQYNDIPSIRVSVPDSTTYYSTLPPQLAIYSSRAAEKHIKITILDSNCDLTWKTAWDTTHSYTNRTTATGNFASGYKSGMQYAIYANTASLASYTNDARGVTETVRVGSLSTYRLMAISDNGLAYPVSDTTKKFRLPINMHWGGGGAGADVTTNVASVHVNSAMATTYVTYLSGQSYSNLTLPTLTTDDGSKTLYLRGSLDNNGYFVSDGNVTLSMSAGYTYIPFGILTTKYSGSTVQVPTQFEFDAINVHAYTIDSSGAVTHIDGIPIKASNITVSDQTPTGGSNGDIWIQY